MSINVNVTGNPVKIHRGKMVTADPDHIAKEFQKRRRMRLEQVRQQSKDIAETVRNRVRNEKNKQLSDVEKQGEKELKKWQARKLLHLQQQYRECLKDIGLGHSEAALEEESDCALETRKESYDKIAKERGQRAVEKLQREKSQELDNKSAGFHKRRYNQLVEGARAKMVADLNKSKKSKKNPFKKKKKKVSTDINISSRLSSDSESESEVPELLNLSSSSSSSSGIPRKRITEHTVSNPSTIVEEPTEKATSSESSKQNLSEETGIQNIAVPSQRYPLDNDHCKGYHYPVDTRISDRIKTRTLLGSGCQKRSENCDISPEHRTAHTVVSDQKTLPVSSPKKLPVAKKSRSKTAFSEEVPVTVSESNYVPFKSASNVEKEEIPNKPPVTLRSTQQKSTAQVPGQSHTKRQSFSHRRKSSAQPTSGGPNLNKVQYYDHRNRFTKEYPEDKSRVQRIPEECIEVCPSDRSEADFIERVYKRDRDAEIRGQKAMEKEKTRRDYQEMMKQLPQLQKKERIASIPFRKSLFHMSDDRLKELEKRRQSNMEDAYERLFPTTRLITLPTKTDQKATTSTLPYANIDIEDVDIPSLNVGTWQHDFALKTLPDTGPKHVESNLMKQITENALGEISDPEKSELERKENLQRMLKSLKSHRDKLAKELSTLPDGSNLHKLVGELRNIDDIIGLGKTADSTDASSKRRKRSRNSRKSKSQKSDQGKASSSSCRSPCRSPKRSPKNQEEKDIKFSRYHVRCTSGSSSSPSPPSKVASTAKTKTERKVKHPTPLILQNTSTQTTPTVERTDDAKKQDKEQRPVLPCKLPVSDSKRPLTKPVICDNKNLKSCDCNLHVHDGKTDVCEIVIKISEEKNPEICVSSPIKAHDKNIIIKASGDQFVAVERSEKKSPTVDKPKEEKEKLKTKSPEVQPSKSKIEPHEKEEKPVVELKKPKSKEKVGTSWREYLSQNSNSSTSYFSPPDFTSTHIQKPPYSEHEVPKIKPTGQLTNILKEKPQQSNIQDYSPVSSSIIQGNKLVEQQLLSYIRRLLTMSHKSVDDLAVSSVSEISTPGSSIINVQTNIHLNQFEDIISHFNLTANYPADMNSSMHYNTAASSSKSTSNTFTSGTISSDTQQTSHDIRDTALDEFSAENYPDVLAVYNKLAENCAKKIENLATLIEKVRLEKLDILRRSPESGSDKENSTRYLDLPTAFKTQQPEKKDTHKVKETDNDNKGQSSDSLTEQEELNRQLLEIDYSFAEQLKKLTPEEIRERYPLSSSTNSSPSYKEDSQQRDSIEQELLTRLRNLKEGDKAEVDSKKNSKATPTSTTYVASTQSPDLPFVPLLMDIPRLPKLETPSVTFISHKNYKPKPPPSKGLAAVKRFNIDVVPHELSTIIEAESLLSARLQKSKTPERHLEDQDIPAVAIEAPLSKKDDNEVKLKESSNKEQRDELVGTIIDNIPTDPPTSSSDSLPDILAELMKSAKDQTQTSKSDKTSTKSAEKGTVQKNLELPSDNSSASELENMEATLRSLGMGWAIATLRKTQEALALTSSSSSTDGSRQQKPIDSSISTSDLSLKDILNKPSLGKSSTIYSKSEDSNTSSRFLRELQDISGSYDKSNEKTSRRTSTPIQSIDKSKSDSPQRIIGKMESEISSIKPDSDENSRGPFYSLNESSVRSKNST